MRLASRALLLAAMTWPALAQTPASPGIGPAQTTPADAATGQVSPGAVSPNLPAGSPPSQAQAAPEPGILSLSASFVGDAKPIRSGLVWRIYEERAGVEPRLVTRSTVATPALPLGPGSYIVHLAYGFASATTRVAMNSSPRTERLTVGAGALKLGGAIGDVPIPPERISFSVYIPVGNDSEGRLVSRVRAGDLVRLPEGSYHVVSSYGESNAMAAADLKVENGRATEATLNHKAATMTLKLVASGGGEAFAGTAFSVLTPGGDVIREAIGAFPTVTLAEGDYVLIARHDGRVYTRDFKVESGLDRDVEVMVTPT